MPSYPTEASNTALGLALIAARTNAALKQLEQGKPLTEGNKKSLNDCEAYLLRVHQNMARLVATRRLSDFSHEFSVPYDLINQTLGHPRCLFDYSGLERISQLIGKLHEQAEASSLKNFFASLYDNSMSYGERTPIETVGRH